MPRGTAVLIDVLANDSDRDGDLLTVTVASSGLPSPAALTNHGDGSFTYSASSQHPLGEFTFDYVLSDGRGHNPQATVTVRVEAGSGSQTPIAVDDPLTTEDGQPIFDLFELLKANDLPNPATLEVASYTQPVNGGSVSPGNGEGIYTPPSEFVESDSFYYTVREGSGPPSAPARVTITITPDGTNQPPIARDDPDPVDAHLFTVEVGSILHILHSDLFRNDEDPDRGPEPLAVSSYRNLECGTLSLNPFLSRFHYTPAADCVGPVTFTYRITDGDAESQPATVTVTVTPPTAPNSPPVAVDDQLIAEQDTPLGFLTSVLLDSNDYDPDGDPFGFYWHSNPAHGNLADCFPLCTYTPAPGYFGPDSFVYTIQDSQLAESLPATVTITVRARLEPSFATSCSGLNCTFDASASVAPADASYTWSFGDGTGGTGAVATHRYSSGGTYTVTLDLAHVTGSEASTSATVDVVDPAVVLLLILD